MVEKLFRPERAGVDTRKRRHFFRLIRKVELISAVVLVWMVGAAILYGAFIVVFEKPYFKVDKIEVVGDLRALSRDEVVKISGIVEGEHLLGVAVGEAQERLMKTSWVKEAAVHRKFPNMAWIYVREYTPEAIVRADGWYYVDRSGTPFRRLMPDDKKDLPVITGLEGMAGEGFGPDFRSKVVELLNVKGSYESSSIGEIYGLAEVHFNKNRGVSIITLNDPMELRLGCGPFTEKLERLEAAYPAMRSHGGIIAYVDLSPEGKVVVKYGA